MDTQDIGRRYIRARRHWRWAVGLNVCVSLLLVVLLAILLNGLASRFYWRADVSQLRLYALSDQTVQLLRGLNEPVRVILLYQRGSDWFHDIESLLREYQHQTPLLTVEYVDPDRSLARTEELSHAYGVDEPNVVIVASGDRSVLLTTADIMEYDFSAARERAGPAHVRFKGEQAFSTAIMRVTREEAPIVYFLSGHGQRRIDNFDRFVGYSSIARRMQRDHIEPRTLLLGEHGGIPADAAALVIAGPSRRISQPELDLIDAYLERSGRVFMLLDAMTESGLDALLARWGVALGQDVVMDPSRTLTGRELFVTEYGMHPITRPVRGVTTVFYSPRSVEPVAPAGAAASDEADKPHATVLAASSEAGWAERDPDQMPLRFDPGVDRAGPVAVAVAVERGPVPGIDVQIRSTRLVVVGDSAFAANGALTGGDEDFFMSALHWLLDREEWMGIAPRTLASAHLVLSRSELGRLTVWTLVGLPAVVAGLGLVIWFRRRI